MGTDRIDPYFELNEDGGYPSDGSITHMDDYPSYEIAEGLFFRPVFARHLSLNFVTFPPASGFPMHTHPEEQVSIVREGTMEITIGDEVRRVRAGDVIIFPPHVPHAGRTAGEGCRLIDIFSPPRTGIREVIASSDPQRSSEVDRWWQPEDEASPAEGPAADA